MVKSLKDRIKEAIKERGIRVPALALQTKIPKDRIYAWYRDGTTPKAEDVEVLENWLSQGSSNKNGEKVSREINAGVVPAHELIEVLKEQNEFLRRNFETSLAGILVQSASILAHVGTSLEKDDEREAGGNKEKLQRLKSDTGKRIREKLQVHQNKDTG